MTRPVGVRWTIGDVSPRGFQALQLSARGAVRIFGERAAYCVCVNSVGLDDPRLAGLPPEVEVRDTTADKPDFLVRHFDPAFAQGVGWKFAPPRVFPDRYEVSLDNDCILWDVPEAMVRWLADGADDAFLIAADVREGFGRFRVWCPEGPRNSGIRGLPPGFDLVGALTRTLALVDPPLTSELDEQGLQVAALERSGRVFVVSVDDVTICSPFWPHRRDRGRCGAHFVGLNARDLPWDWYGRPASECVREHFDAHLDALWSEVAG